MKNQHCKIPASSIKHLKTLNSITPNQALENLIFYNTNQALQPPNSITPNQALQPPT
jgi:hypothetical protein